MIYKPTQNSRYWMAKWKFRGQVIRRSTRETSKKAAYAVELRMRAGFNKDQEEITKATLRFGCGPEAIGYCPECNGLLRLDRAAVAVDGMKVCRDSCRGIW